MKNEEKIENGIVYLLLLIIILIFVTFFKIANLDQKITSSNRLIIKNIDVETVKYNTLKERIDSVEKHTVMLQKHIY